MGCKKFEWVVKSLNELWREVEIVKGLHVTVPVFSRHSPGLELVEVGGVGKSLPGLVHHTGVTRAAVLVQGRGRPLLGAQRGQVKGHVHPGLALGCSHCT